MRARNPFHAALIKLAFNTMLKPRADAKATIADLVARWQFEPDDLGLDPRAFELSRESKRPIVTDVSR